MFCCFVKQEDPRCSFTHTHQMGWWNKSLCSTILIISLCLWRNPKHSWNTALKEKSILLQKCTYTHKHSKSPCRSKHYVTLLKYIIRMTLKTINHYNEMLYVFDLVAKLLVTTLLSCITVPGFDSVQLWLSPVISHYCRPVEASVMTQEGGFLPASWKTWAEFQLLYFGLQAIQGVWGVNQQVGVALFFLSSFSLSLLLSQTLASPR